VCCLRRRKSWRSAGGLLDPRIWWSVSLIELDVDHARLMPEMESDSTDSSGVRVWMHEGCSIRVN
jgi:hypothetical protein